MTKKIDLIVKNGSYVTHKKTIKGDIAVHKGKIYRVGNISDLKASKTIDARGLHILPGAIDTQVHFREPGNTCLLYTSPSPRDKRQSRMPSSA